jgi:protein involved in polysaccharide export with SLBB domain
MNKLVLLRILLIACFGCAAVEAQVDRDQNSQAPCVVVAGAVHSPMRFELKRRPVKVLEALAFAGGPTQRASGIIKLIRTGEPCYQKAWAHKVWPDHRLEVTELAFADIQRGTESANPYLKAGDVVLVVESDPIYVSGSVATPRAIYFKQAPSLLNAIALAGGAVGVTGDTEVVIFRAGDDKGYKEFVRINLSELNKHPKRSPLLHATDIIYLGPAGNLVPPKSPLRFDSPPFDYRPASPSAIRARNGIATL